MSVSVAPLTVGRPPSATQWPPQSRGLSDRAGTRRRKVAIRTLLPDLMAREPGMAEVFYPEAW